MTRLVTLLTLLQLALPGQAACEFAPPKPIHARGANGCVSFMVELALEPQQQSCGLSGRDHLAEDHGMLFDFRGRASVNMWMHDTRVPLDMVFINKNGRVISIHHDAVPYSEDIIPAPHGTAAVLELLAGVTQSAGLVEGSVVQHPMFTRSPGSISCGR